MSKTRGRRLARFRSLFDRPKKQQGPEYPTLPWLLSPPPPDPGILVQDMAALMGRHNDNMARSMLSNNTVSQPESSTLTATMILECVRQLEAQTPVSLTHMSDLLMPGLIGLGAAIVRGSIDDAAYRGAERPENYPELVTQWGRALYSGGEYPRIDFETVARSKERARSLLKSLLIPEQWAEFEASREVTERINGCEFKLSPGGMIQARKPRLVGTVSERWCISPNPYADGNDYMPDEDKLIGQLLHLRAGPDRLRAMSNVFPGA